MTLSAMAHPSRRFRPPSPLRSARAARRFNLGVTLIEMLGALALAALLAAGAVALAHAAMDDLRAQHAGRHQAEVRGAAERYIREHYADLLSLTATAPVAVPISTLVSLLPPGFEPANAFGQIPCLRVMQPSPGRLNALVVSEGGESIDLKALSYVAAHAGPGGGQIDSTDPSTAHGAFGSWSVPVAAYGSAACGAAVPGTPANRLASTLFFGGPDTSASDFLYRNEVPGHPELNALQIPLGLQGRAVVVENDTADPLCQADDPQAQGRVGVDAGGMLMSCQGGAWRRQASAFWKDPVETFSALPLAGNQPGETRLTLDTQRAFAWSGSGWQPLGVDADGNMVVPGTSTAGYLQVASTEASGTPCATDGLISKDASGMILTCSAHKWALQASQELAYTEAGSSVILPSSVLTYPPGTSFYAGPFAYDAPNDVVTATIERDLLPTRDGLIIANASAAIDVRSVDTPTDSGQVSLGIMVFDRDTGALVANNRTSAPRMVNDTTTVTVTLSKAVPRNTNGYRVQLLVSWCTYKHSYATSFWNRANYFDVFGGVVERTPLQTSWTLDLTY